MKWTPTYPLGNRTRSVAKLAVINGTVRPAEQNIEPQTEVLFTVQRASVLQPMQLVPQVDRRGNGKDSSISIPPILPRTFTIRVRTWPARGTTPDVGFPLRSDDGGGDFGANPKVEKRCIVAEGGILLTSGSNFEQGGQNPRTPILEAQESSICYTFGTVGVETFGRQGFSQLNNFRFFAFEVVPDSVLEKENRR